MSANLKKLFFAASVSTAVFAGTYYWYKKSEVTYSNNSGEQALAFVGKMVDDIQRRPASRLLWQSVKQGESLFNGEAIRTPSTGEVRIQFVGSDRYIDLEADSLIVIKKSEGEIALDLMEGSLFVASKSNSENEPGLVLTSDGNKVDLTNASATLSKNSGSKLDLQILEGKASIKDKTGNSKELGSGQSGAINENGITFNSSLVKIISPVPAKTIYLLDESKKAIPFAWSGFPADTKVELHIGKSRKSLTKEFTTELNASNASLDLTYGKLFWKLVATDKNGNAIGETPVYKNEILPRQVPSVLVPTSNAEIISNTETYNMSFRWQNPPLLKSTQIEIWKSDNTQIFSKSFGPTEESAIVPNLKTDTYTWRISAQFTDDDSIYVGKKESFNLKFVDPIKPEIKVDIAWTIPQEQLKQYFVQSPKIKLSWNTPTPEVVTQWRLKVSEENPQDGNAVTPIVQTVNSLENEIPLQRPGRYIASVEAIDEKGKVIGTSPSQILESAELPTLNSPEFELKNSQIQASNDGKADIKWLPLDGAKEYTMSIFKNGKELRKNKYSTTTAALTNLMPGQYEIQLQALDHYGRPGELSEKKVISVPDKSNVKAPSLKKIKVN